MQTGFGDDSGEGSCNVVPLFPEIEGDQSILSPVRIGRLRWLMLVFDDQYILTGLGSFVASRLDHVAGIPYRPGVTAVTMVRVYFFARSAGLIKDCNGRETPDADFVSRARELQAVRCTTCGMGEREFGEGRCWVCDARMDSQYSIGVHTSHGGGA